MKHCFFTALIMTVLLYSSCKQEETVTKSNATKLQQQVTESQAFALTLNEGYQKLPAFVQYYKDPAAEDYDFESQNFFIASSGLPLEAGFPTWSKQHSVDEAVELCKSFIASHQDHKYINVFKQYSAWLLITRYKMLSPYTGENENVEYLTVNLIDAKYKGYNLLYCCLQYMKDNKVKTEAELKALSKAVIKYSQPADKNDNHPANATAATQTNKPIDPRMQELINKYDEEVNRNQEYLSQIMGL